MSLLNAPLTAVAGIFVLNEVLSLLAFLGCILITIQIVIAVFYGLMRLSSTHWDIVHGSLPIILLFVFYGCR